MNELPEWIADVSGWGVVLVVVRWMMSRIDNLITSYDGSMKATIEEFKAFRLQEQSQHASMERTQHEILDLLRDRT